MGLLLSVLVGCVGVLELLACLRHASDGVVISINPPTPCLSYHEPADNDIQSIHDSLCSFSHSTVRLPRSARHKLENLHEYSLRVRGELRSLDRNLDGTLSECSTRYLIGGGSMPDSRLSPESRLSPDFSYLMREDDGTWCVRDADGRDRDYEYDDTRRSLDDLNAELRESLRQVALSRAPPKPDGYVRIPTPIPFTRDEEAASATSTSSSEVDTSFEKDLDNEAITRSFDGLSTIKYCKDSRSVSSVDESEHEERGIARKSPGKSPSRSPGSSRKPGSVQSVVSKRVSLEKPSYEPAKADSTVTSVENETERIFVSQRKPKSGKSTTTILRKPTRLKSRNAEVSRSAENLSAQKRSKDRDPERRKSDISVQTVRDLLRDMSTNTSPTSSPLLSRSDSKKSISVEVQTTIEDMLLDDETLEELENSVIGLSESRKDVLSRGSSARKSFKNRRFRSSSGESPDGCGSVVTLVERSRDGKRDGRSLRVSSFEDASEEDYEKIRSIISESTNESNGWRRRRGWSRREDSWSKSSTNDDDEFTDAEDVSCGRLPIQYTTPDTDQNKAFWVIQFDSRSRALHNCINPQFDVVRVREAMNNRLRLNLMVAIGDR